MDLAAESFAGPHDKANSPWFYDGQGLAPAVAGLKGLALESLTNYTTSLVFATPFAAAAVADQLNYTAWGNWQR